MDQIQNNNYLTIKAHPGVHEDVSKYILSYLTPGSNILELGAGSGAFSLKMKNSGYKVIASDIHSNSFLANDIPFFNIDLNGELPPEHLGKYDAVVAIEVIEHVENIYDFFRKIHRLLNDKGVAFVTTPNIGELGSRLKYLISGEFIFITNKHFASSGHIQVLPSWLILKAVEKCNLTIQEIVGIGHTRKGWRKIIVSCLLFLIRMVRKEKFNGEFSNLILLLILSK